MMDKSAGAQVDLASGGEEAISKALSRAYDLVLMDIQMPVPRKNSVRRTIPT